MENLTLDSSKPRAKTQQGKYKYNKVLIVGNNFEGDLQAFQEKNPSTLFIGDGVNVLEEKYINQTLHKNKEEIDPQATYCVRIHGFTKKLEGGGYEQHNNQEEEKTKDIFDIISKFSQSLLSASPAQGHLTKIILASCHAGAAQHIDTPKNSLIFAQGSQHYRTLTSYRQVLSHLNILHESTEKFAMALCEGGETCYIIKKEQDEDAEIAKVRRPKTQADYQNPKTHFQVQWSNLKNICKELPATLPQEFDEEKIKKARDNALLISAWRVKSEQTQYALDFGANINAVNENNETALYIASFNCHLEMVKLLLDKNANVNAVSKNKNTALHIASEYGHNEVVKILLQNRADINAVNADIDIANDAGNTALHIASKNRYLEIVKLLLDKNANVNAVNQNKNTALHIASEYGYDQIVGELLKRMPEEQRDEFIKKQNEEGNTALHLVSQCDPESIKVVEALLNGMSPEQRAELINTKNKDGSTALHIATENYHYDVVKALLENGADINAVDNNKDTPLSLAQDNHNNKIIQLLREYAQTEA